jgi:hypothetical protein
MPIRIQFVCYHVLIAEVIVQGMREASRVEAAYLQSRYKRGLPMGGSLKYRADLSRFWNVPVGGQIQ